MDAEIPEEIQQQLAPVADRISRIGFTVTIDAHDAAHFGNYLLQLTGDKPGWMITRDRGQYILQAPSLAQEKAFGPSKVFASLIALIDALEAHYAHTP